MITCGGRTMLLPPSPVLGVSASLPNTTIFLTTGPIGSSGLAGQRIVLEQNGRLLRGLPRQRPVRGAGHHFLR